ncbi:MAG: cyclic nucleotide-binding domain-containing protein [Gammaproteobacteria bacterium]|nr:cyclic nucleotide-binding domain-containing protein [Gammaproteobacteria bacterium]
MLPITKVPKIKLLEIIARIDFFKPFSLAEREILLERSSCYKCVKGQKIQSELDNNSHFYIVLSGQVSIFKHGSDTVLGNINVGEFIGEGSFIKKRPKSATAKAITDSIVLCVDQGALTNLPHSIKDKFKDSVIEGMAKRIVYLTKNIQELKNINAK